jgi:hypothetical protein
MAFLRHGDREEQRVTDNSRKATTTRRKAAKSRPKTPPPKWSAKVTEKSNALDLDRSLFNRSPTAIAQSLKRSAELSKRRKSSPFRSAMSMLTFYINRAGKNLSATRRKKLDTAKEKLREAFGR